MLYRKILEALDGTLRDLRGTDEVMGGLPTLLCGYFRQSLPVVPNATRASVIDAYLKKICPVELRRSKQSHHKYYEACPSWQY